MKDTIIGTGSHNVSAVFPMSGARLANLSHGRFLITACDCPPHPVAFIISVLQHVFKGSGLRSGMALGLNRLGS